MWELPSSKNAKFFCHIRVIAARGTPRYSDECYTSTNLLTLNFKARFIILYLVAYDKQTSVKLKLFTSLQVLFANKIDL